jgi:transcriptional regulator with XRE-family HTH domain
MKPNEMAPDMQRAYRMLPERLYKRRRELHLTQMQVWMDTGIAMSSISQFENGRRIPTFENLLVLASYYGVKVGWLLGETD